ncbi:MAG: hypothetical protein RAK22_01155 [Nanoarchaeota archaeon]|nr:hypothetical protein [Nanoarchaeota archaeon]
MITYSEFIRIRRAEEESKDFTPLSDKTLDEMRSYVSLAKRSLLEAQNANDEERASEISLQIKNAVSTIDSIFNLRLKKLMNLILLDIPLTQQIKDKLLTREIEVYDQLKANVSSFKSSIITDIKNAAPAEELKESKKEEEQGASDKSVIKVLSDIPQFVWKNHKTYGPYSFPNVIEIDKEIADILIKSGKAVLA